jgi:hypothetical protein
MSKGALGVWAIHKRSINFRRIQDDFRLANSIFPLLVSGLHLHTCGVSKDQRMVVEIPKTVDQKNLK